MTDHPKDSCPNPNCRDGKIVDKVYGVGWFPCSTCGGTSQAPDTPEGPYKVGDEIQIENDHFGAHPAYPPTLPHKLAGIQLAVANAAWLQSHSAASREHGRLKEAAARAIELLEPVTNHALNEVSQPAEEAQSELAAALEGQTG